MTKSLLRSKYIKNCTYENWSNYKKQVLYKYFASILKVSYKYYNERVATCDNGNVQYHDQEES